jgi:hypothetical protein
MSAQWIKLFFSSYLSDLNFLQFFENEKVPVSIFGFKRLNRFLDNQVEFENWWGPIVSASPSSTCHMNECYTGRCSTSLHRAMPPYRTPPCSTWRCHPPIPIPHSPSRKKPLVHSLLRSPRVEKPPSRPLSSAKAGLIARSSPCHAWPRCGGRAGSSSFPFARCPGSTSGKPPSTLRPEPPPLSPHSPGEDPLWPFLVARWAVPHHPPTSPVLFP